MQTVETLGKWYAAVHMVCSVNSCSSGVIGRGYGEGSGAIHIRDVICSGSERSITSCNYITNTVLTSHAQDVGVECQQGQCLNAHIACFDFWMTVQGHVDIGCCGNRKDTLGINYFCMHVNIWENVP